MKAFAFISRLNWRHILLHFFAFWFFIYSFETFSFLLNTNLIDAYRKSNGHLLSDMSKLNSLDTETLTYFLLSKIFFGLAVLLVAFLISLFLSIKRRWFWGNNLVVLIIIYTMYRFDLLGWSYLRSLFWYTGQKFSDATIEFTLNGMILLIPGLLLFFLKQSNRFIENRKPVTV